MSYSDIATAVMLSESCPCLKWTSLCSQGIDPGKKLHAPHSLYAALQAESGKVNPDQAKQVAPDLVSPPGKDDEATAGEKKTAEGDAVSEPVLKPELKTASKPKTKGADGRREAAEARREAAQKVSPS